MISNLGKELYLTVAKPVAKAQHLKYTSLFIVVRELLQTPPSQEAHLHPAPCDIISVRPARGGASETSACSPRLPVRPFVKMRDSSSLPSSPGAGGGRRRLPCSLPCSPLLGRRSWRSPPFSSTPSALSRLWVEAALQRSKTSCRPPACSRGEGEGEEEEEEEGEGETGEDGDSELLCLDSWSCCQLTPCKCSRCPSAPPYEEDVQTVSSFNKHHQGSTALSQRTVAQETDTQETDTQETDVKETDTQETDVKETDTQETDTKQTVDQETDTKETDVKETDTQETDTKQTVDQETDTKETDVKETDTQETDVKETDTQETVDQETEGDSEESLPRVRALQLGESSGLYPSLSQWRITAGTQAELSKKQKQEGHNFHTCFHGNNSDDHLQQLCVMISGVSGEQTDCAADLSFILKKVFESTSCSKRTDRPVESCSFCSEEFSMQIRKHHCRNCEQVTTKLSETRTSENSEFVHLEMKETQGFQFQRER
ncbi:smoothelin-like 1 [Thunnus thynnus]|uniref:smoothelin-like 1 n=1 Tax=Thunnus thynnus TaxID=8237 RepID=UPI003527B949